MFCKCGYNATSTITQVVVCPLCGSDILVRSLEDQGRHAWHMLHSQESPTEQWFYQEWMKLIPKNDCRCREQFTKLLRWFPPDFDNFKDWAVMIHNKVNEHLGKPQWPSSEWGKRGKRFAQHQPAEG